MSWGFLRLRSRALQLQIVKGRFLWLVAVVALVVLPGEAGSARATGGTTVTFSYTGAVQTWTVPTGVTY